MVLTVAASMPEVAVRLLNSVQCDYVDDAIDLFRLVVTDFRSSVAYEEGERDVRFAKFTLFSIKFTLIVA